MPQHRHSFFLEVEEDDFEVEEDDFEAEEDDFDLIEDDKPIKIYLSQDDPVYTGYRNVSQKNEIENPGDRNIWFTYDNLAQYLEDGNTLQSTIETGISTLKVVERIILQLDNC